MRPRLKWVVPLMLAMLGLALAVRCMGSRKSSRAIDRTAQNLHSLVGEIRFERAPFEQALGELGRRAWLPMSPQWEQLRQAGVNPDTPVTLDIPRGSARAALGDLLDCAGQGRAPIEFFIDDRGAVAITSGADYHQHALVSRSYDIRSLVPPGGDSGAAGDVIADMVRRLIDNRPPAGIVPHDVAVQVIAGRLAVVADRETQFRIEPFLRGRKAAQVKTMARLASLKLPGSRIWNNRPLGAVLQDLSREFDVTIAPDWPMLEQHGIESDIPITARLRNINLGKLLHVFLNASKLQRQEPVGWTVNPAGTVVVTMQRQIDRTDYTIRMYDLYPITRSWPAEPWKRLELSRAVVVLIQNTVAPDSWQSRRGEAWVRVDGWRYYICQTSDAHRQITALLDQVFKSHRLPPFRGSQDADVIPAP